VKTPAKERLIFLHVPRTAGSTLHGVMMRQYGPKEILTAELLDPAEVERVQAMPEKQRARVRVLKGHLPFGAHVHFPGPSRYFTMTRDPIERIVSLYHYMRRNERHRDHDTLRSMSLSEFLQDDRWTVHTDNSFVRLIAGEPELARGAVDEACLDRAAKNIEGSFVAAGSSASFDETLVFLKRTYGWSGSIGYKRQNVNPAPPDRDDLDDESARLLIRWTELDHALVEYCESHLQEAIARQPDDFHEEVERLKRMDGPEPPPRSRLGRLLRSR
jgi:hypothetical protein